jgi:hypothetical protein
MLVIKHNIGEPHPSEGGVSKGVQTDTVGNWIKAAFSPKHWHSSQTQLLAEVGLQRSHSDETSNYRADYKHLTHFYTAKRAENHDLASAATNAHTPCLAVPPVIVVLLVRPHD